MRQDKEIKLTILFARFSGRPDDLELRGTSGILDLNKMQA